jgi:serine/threonine-protein kinase HipA
MPTQLEVWLLGSHVGTLMQMDGRLAFSYAPAWLQRAAAGAATVPLSQSLPLQAGPFDDRATRPFFAGLLPEGEKRRLVAKALQASRQNDFALLDGIGGECAGAVTLLAPGQTPTAPIQHAAVRWLDERALLHLLDEMPQRPMLAGQEGLRLSLAGAQDKLPVVVEPAAGNVPLRIGLPLFGAPSTHILKPAIAGVDGSVFNEAFFMTLAGALKLPVAPAQIQRVAGRTVLLVQRYDRVPSTDAAGAVQPARLHQEDFCQAMGVPPEHKYQNEGGPDLAQCFALLRRATRPSAPHTLALLDLVVFNALIGNHDAHGKNFSLLYGPAGTGLAPLYDALCTAAYPQLTDKMAMKLGGKYRFSEVMARHWEQFARDAGLSPAQVKKRVIDIARRLPDMAHQIRAGFEAHGYGSPVLSRIVALVERRCALTLRRLTDTSTSA